MRGLSGDGTRWCAPAVVLCLAVAGCRDQSPERLVDLEMQLRTSCEAICARWDECAPLPEDAGTCDVEECVSVELDGPLDPCLAQRVELGRCYAERETCGDYFDNDVPGAPGTICYEFVQLAFECVLEHEDEIDANTSQGGT